MPKIVPSLDAQTLALLKERRAMFAGTPSVLPDLHRRLRVAAMEKTSLREALRNSWTDLLEHASALVSPRGFTTAAAFAAVALACFIGLRQGVPAGQRLLTLGAEAPVPAVQSSIQYALNDAASIPVSLDQRIDQMTAGEAEASRDLNSDPAQHAASAHYVLTSAPASYDSVVAF